MVPDRDHSGEPVEPGVGPNRRETPQRNAGQRRPAERGQREGDGVGELLGHRQRDAAIGEHVGAEVALQHVADEDHELVGNRLVQVHLGGVGGLDLGCRPGAERDAHRVAGNRVEHHEQRRDRQQDDDDREGETLQQIPPHAARMLLDLPSRSDAMSRRPGVARTSRRFTATAVDANRRDVRGSGLNLSGNGRRIIAIAGTGHPALQIAEAERRWRGEKGSRQAVPVR